MHEAELIINQHDIEVITQITSCNGQPCTVSQSCWQIGRQPFRLACWVSVRWGNPPCRRRWHCKACDCFVGDVGWQGHTRGICHRRHILSLREFGKPGGMVVSTFEAPSGETPRGLWKGAFLGEE